MLVSWRFNYFNIYVSPYILTGYQYIKRVTRIDKTLRCWMLFSKKVILLPVFFQKILTTRSNNVIGLKHFTEPLVDKNGEWKAFVIRMKNSAFVVWDIHVDTQMTSLNVSFKCLHYTKETFWAFNWRRTFNFLQKLFHNGLREKCQYLPFIVF